MEDVEKKPYVLSDMRGGYLTRPTLGMVGLISSKNLSHFNIELDDIKYKDMLYILNQLQKQGFKINKKVLEFIKILTKDVLLRVYSKP